MIMDRTEKVRKLQELKKEIKRKELQIIKKQSELKILEEEYMQEETSELPILLFLIDETLPMPDEPRDFMYEYVYYCPDTDKKLDVLLLLDPESKNVITNFAKYKNLLLISAKYMELSLLEKQKFSVEMLFDIFQHDFKNDEINTKINEQLNVYDYCYSLNVL